MQRAAQFLPREEPRLDVPYLSTQVKYALAAIDVIPALVLTLESSFSRILLTSKIW